MDSFLRLPCRDSRHTCRIPVRWRCIGCCDTWIRHFDILENCFFVFLFKKKKRYILVPVINISFYIARQPFFSKEKKKRKEKKKKKKGENLEWTKIYLELVWHCCHFCDLFEPELALTSPLQSRTRQTSQMTFSCCRPMKTTQFNLIRRLRKGLAETHATQNVFRSVFECLRNKTRMD